MNKKNDRVVLPHKIPADLRRSIFGNIRIQKLWESLTPLARNEWICWVEFVKKPETRRQHIERVSSDLLAGKRRPCCWAGCKHRK